MNRDLLLLLEVLCSYVYTVLDIKKEVSLNRVDIDAAGDGVNALAFGYFLAFTSHRPTHSCCSLLK